MNAALLHPDGYAAVRGGGVVRRSIPTILPARIPIILARHAADPRRAAFAQD
jgi:hypothetical protein